MFAVSLKPQRCRIKPIVCVLLLIWMISCGCRPRLVIRPTPQMNIEERFRIKVLLFDDVTNFVLQVPSSFAVARGYTHFNRVYFEKPAQPVKVRISQGKMLIADRLFDNKLLTILPDEPFVFAVDRRNYRGNLKLVLNEDASSFDVINIVPLEAYIAGVLGAEMPNYWEPEALKTQAIAARTYGLYIKKRFGSKRPWDLRGTQASQVYMGLAAESPQVWQAVKNTHGQVLLCRFDNGRDELFPAYYSSACGGHTENSKKVFGDSFTCLVGVPCSYCKDVVRASLFYWPMVLFDKSLVSSRILKRYPALKNLGRVVRITPTAQSDYPEFSRLTSLKLTGSSGKTGFLRAEDFRLTVDSTGRKIKSTICQVGDFGDRWAFVSGRGYGHGVGLCQCGAQAMARRGKTAEEILSYYYPGSKIATVY